MFSTPSIYVFHMIGMAEVLSYVAQSFTGTSSTDDFFLSFWFVNSFEMLFLVNFFPIVC